MPILLDGIACSGYEDSIVDCYSSDWFETDCTHDEDAGAICLEGDAANTVITTTPTSFKPITLTCLCYSSDF